jgi:hypothetical protein
MKYPSGRVSSVGIFFAATVLLILYLLSIRYHISLPVAVFWVAVSLMLGTIVYQSLQLKLSSDYAKVILFEIAITCLVLHLIYQIPYYGLRGSDVYMDMASAKGILSSGFVGGGPEYTAAGTFYFPMIHILGAQLSLITNIDLFSVVKWFPALFDVALIPLLYLLIRNIFKEERVALLSTLLFALLQHHILFSSLFVRETIALVLAVCCLYLYFSARSSVHPVAYSALSIMCLVGTVCAHHLTSFVLLVFLLIHFLVGKASESPFLRRTYLGDNIAGEKTTSSFVSIAFVAVFAYWIFIVISPLHTLVTFAKEVFAPGQLGTATYGELTGIALPSIQSFRGYVLFFGFYSISLIFIIILLYGLLPRLRHRQIEALSSTLLLFLCGISGLIAIYLVPFEIIPYPDRFLMFGWLFGFAPLVAIILSGRYKWLIRAGIFLLTAFMIFNIYQIEPTAWDARAEEIPSATLEEDYALANTFDFSTDKIATNTYSRYAIYDVQNNLGENALSISEDINLSEFDWLVIQKEALRLEQKYNPEPRTEAIAEMRQLVKECSPDRNRIYESNNLSVFKLRE